MLAAEKATGTLGCAIAGSVAREQKSSAPQVFVNKRYGKMDVGISFEVFFIVSTVSIWSLRASYIPISYDLTAPAIALANLEVTAYSHKSSTGVCFFSST